MRAGLPAFVLAQVAGILAVELGLARAAPGRVVAWVALTVCAVAAFRSPRVAMAAGMLGFFVLGAAVASRARIDEASLPDWPVGVRATVDARVDSVRGMPGYARVDLCDLAWQRRGDLPLPAPGCVRLRVDADEPGHGFWTSRAPGEVVRTRVALKPLDPLRNPGGVARAPALLRRGIWARASLAHPEAFVVLAQDEGAPSAELARRRIAARQGRDAACERLLALGRGGALLAALGLGAADRLDPGFRDDLARLGLSHLVAVSGLHLGMVAALGFALLGAIARALRWGGRLDPEPLQWTSAAVCAVGYALLCGFGTPARRALVFIALLLALHALARRPAWARVWWWAASWVLAADPAALFELGPQLSFGITAALAGARFDDGALRGPEATGWQRSTGWLRSAFAVSAVALSASSLILALHGRPTSAWSLAANVLAVPLTGLLLLPSALIAAGLAWCAIDAPVIDAMLRVLAAVPSAFEASVCEAARWLGPLPQGGRPGLDALAAGAAACGVALRARAALVKAVAAWAGVAVLGWGGVLHASGVVGWIGGLHAAACVASPGTSAADGAGERGGVPSADGTSGPGRPWSADGTSARGGAPCADATAGPDGVLEIVALDVGQGDALLLRADGVAVLVDAGWASPLGGFDAGRQVVVPALAALGVERLDLLVLSHGDLDHRGGAGAVLDAVEVDEIWVPRPMIDAPVFASLQQRAVSSGVRWRGRARGDAPLRIGGLDLEVLWPPGDLDRTPDNDASLVLRARRGASHVLLMGDAGFATERALLAAGAPLRADVLKVGHHGSATASSAAFLRAVSPRWALISAGCGVERALPSDASLARIEQGTERVLWTGRDGALRIGLDAGGGIVRHRPVWPARRCRASASAAGTAASDPAPAGSRAAPRSDPTTLPLWGGSRRVVAPRERRRHRWGRTHATRSRATSRGRTGRGGRSIRPPHPGRVERGRGSRSDRDGRKLERGCR